MALMQAAPGHGEGPDAILCSNQGLETRCQYIRCYFEILEC